MEQNPVRVLNLILGTTFFNLKYFFLSNKLMFNDITVQQF